MMIDPERLATITQRLEDDGVLPKDMATELLATVHHLTQQRDHAEDRWRDLARKVKLAMENC